MRGEKCGMTCNKGPWLDLNSVAVYGPKPLDPQGSSLFLTLLLIIMMN